MKPDPEAVKVLEDAQIQWRRDYDAVLVGFVLGVLVGLAW